MTPALHPWHIFGNDGQRYRTIEHSADFDPAWSGPLERCVWGQARGSDYLRTLNQEPALWSRRVSGERIALTRVFMGEHDAAGRFTQCFVSVVLSNDEWAHSIATALDAVARDPGFWAVSARLPASAHADPAPSRQAAAGPTDQLAAHLRGALAGGESLIVDNALLTLAGCQSLFRQLDPRERAQCTFAYRAVAADLDVRLNVLDPQSNSATGLSRTRTLREGVLLRSPERVPAAATAPPPDAWPSGSHTPALRLEATPDWAGEATAMTVAGHPAVNPDFPEMHMTKSVALSFIAIALLLVVSLANDYGRAAASTNAGSGGTNDLDQLRLAIGNQSDALSQARTALESRAEGLDSQLAKLTESTSGRFAALESQLAGIQERLEELPDIDAHSVDQGKLLDAIRESDPDRVELLKRAADALDKLRELESLIGGIQGSIEKIGGETTALTVWVDDVKKVRNQIVTGVESRFKILDDAAGEVRKATKDLVEAATKKK